MLDLLFYALRIGGGQIDFIEHGDDLEVVLQRDIDVCDGLRLHALAGIHDEDRPLAASQRARDLVAKIHVARGVDQI